MVAEVWQCELLTASQAANYGQSRTVRCPAIGVSVNALCGLECFDARWRDADIFNQYVIVFHLEATIPQLDWEKSKLTFGQRMNLLKSEVLVREKRFDSIPAIKHMNTLRNKISHRLEIKSPFFSAPPVPE